MALTDGTGIDKDHPVIPGEGVNVTLDWQIKKDTLLENGMKAVYKLPAQLNFADGSGNLSDNMGSYQVKDQVLTMVFTKNYETATSEEGKLEATVTDYAGTLTLAAKSYEEKSGSEVVKFAAGVQPILYYESKMTESSETSASKETVATTEETKATTASTETKATTESTTETEATKQAAAKATSARQAPRELNGIYNIIKNLVIKDGTGNIVDATHPLVDPSKVTLSFEWILNNEMDVFGGDTYTIQLPDAFMIHNAIKDEPLVGTEEDETGNKKVFGKFTLTVDGLLTITFADGIEELDSRAGTIKVVSTIDTKKITEENEISTGIYDTDGKEIIIEFGTDAPDIQKSGQISGSDTILWTIIFNEEGKNLSNLVLTEYFPAGTSFSWATVYYDADGNNNWTELKTSDSTWKGSQNLDGNQQISFIGDWETFNKKIKVVVSTKITDKNLESYKNRAVISGSNFLDIGTEATVSITGSENYKKLTSYDMTTGLINWEVKVDFKATKAWEDCTYSLSSASDTALHYFVADSFTFEKDGDLLTGDDIPKITFKAELEEGKPVHLRTSDLEPGTYIIKYQTQAVTVPIVPGTKIKNYASTGSSDVIGGDYTINPQKPETDQEIGVTKNHEKIDYNKNTIS